MGTLRGHSCVHLLGTQHNVNVERSRHKEEEQQEPQRRRRVINSEDSVEAEGGGKGAPSMESLSLSRTCKRKALCRRQSVESGALALHIQCIYKDCESTPPDPHTHTLFSSPSSSTSPPTPPTKSSFQPVPLPSSSSNAHSASSHRKLTLAGAATCRRMHNAIPACKPARRQRESSHTRPSISKADPISQGERRHRSTWPW